MSEEVNTPTAKINYRSDEKITIPNSYGGAISYGLSITRDVEDDGLEGIMEAAREIKAEVDSFVAEEREKVLDLIQGGSVEVKS